MERLPGRIPACCIPVKTEHDRLDDAEHPFNMVRAGGSAQSGYAAIDIVLRERNYIHVALDHDELIEAALAAPGLI